MASSILKRLYEWYVKVKIPLHLAVLFSVLLGLVVWGSTVYFFRASIGEAKVVGIGVGVSWDANGDNPVRALSWGKIVINPLQPEASKNVTVYVRNEGDKPTILQLNTSDWQPSSVEEYVSLSWDYGGQVLRIDETVKVNLILSVNSSLWFETPRIQDYSFNIVISAGSP